MLWRYGNAPGRARGLRGKRDETGLDPHAFSLVLGGPLFQLLRRAHMSGDALELMRRRIVVIALLAWLPLLALSVYEGQALDAGDALPFLRDVEVHVRFLIALPLLIVAEPLVHARTRSVVGQFVDRGLVPAGAMTRFEGAIASAQRLRNSVVAEILLLVLVYAVGILIVWRHYVALDAATWYALPTDVGPKLSAAGVWYGYVSLPIFQFLVLRWYFRFFIWTRFLWQVARIDLNLVPTHPDRLGGLGFLPIIVHALVPILVAHGVMLAGPLANRILYAGATLLDFKIDIAVLVVFLLCVALGPLLVFAPRLAQVKRAGEREYGLLAQRYVREFDAKWVRGGAPASAPLLGSNDIQSLADLSTGFDVVRSMRIVPVTRDAVLQTAVATAAPLLPLALTMASPEELVQQLIKILF